MIPPDYYCDGCARLIVAEDHPSPGEPETCADCVLSNQLAAAIDAAHDDATWDDTCWWSRSSRWTA